jgi:hypothetical protein
MVWTIRWDDGNVITLPSKGVLNMTGKINCTPKNTVSPAAMAKAAKGIPLHQAVASSPNKPATVKVGK